MWHSQLRWVRCERCEEWITYHGTFRVVCNKCTPETVKRINPFIVPINPEPGLPWIPRPQDIPGITFTLDKWTNTNRQKCAFDDLPPGVYGLVCTCPNCQPRMVSNVQTQTYKAQSSVLC